MDMFSTRNVPGAAFPYESMSFPPQFEAPSPEELHELLPAYDVLAFIAKGGMGAVYKAHQKSLERDVAIKILPREFGADEDFRKRFEDEAKAMAKLNHPNLIGVYDFGEVDGMPYIVMEFVDGKSLHHSAHGKAIEQKEVARLVNGICDGLAHAHDAGILHRDIKPANILLDSKKRPKIGDFGLARAADETEGDGLIFGTPDYTAPEVMKDSHAVDKRSDVFSTGIILYELLTGKVPDANYMPASQIEEVDPRFDKIIRRATHPSPTLRFADAGAMGKDLKVLQIALEKKLATMVAQAPVAPLLTPTEGDSEAPAPVAVPQVQVATGPNWSLLRNLIIIVLLVGAIYGMSRAYKWQKQNIADQKIEQEKKDQKEKMEIIAEQLRVKKERDRTAALKPPDIDPANLPVEPKVETPLDALARLKKSLLVLDKESRDSQEFPPTTHVRGSSRFFFVETPLSWQRAAAYAEDHGGHLATCINEGEKNWLSSKTPKKTTVWLGGGATGRTAWGWVDGTKWAVRKPSTSTGNSATLSDLGSIRAKPGGRKYPFFIQWRMDGSNPGSLAAQLERLKKSLETPDPIFPPGVLSFESRRYLIIEKQVSWEEAAIIAQGAHGHLAVPSAQTEGEYLMAAVSSTLPAGAGAWLGGQHNGRSWTWATGEPWAFASWAPDSPDGNEAVDTAVRLVAGDDGGWDDANPSDPEAAAAFVIEWSKDRSSTTTAAPTAGGGDWSALRAESLKKVQILEGKYATALAENGKGLKWDLNFWHRGLRDNDERTYAPAVARVKAKVQPDGTIAIAQNEIIKLPPRGVQVVKKHLTEQQQLEATLVSRANKIRIEYLAGLGEKKSTAQNSGLNSQIRAIDNEIEACGKSGKTFLEHFGSGS
jgi:serine/threonine protein kinase